MATYGELTAYLASVPGALVSWAEPLFAARLTLPTVQAFIDTMASDRTSPLREAEEGILSKEIMRMNAELGEPVAGDVGRLKVRLKMVLSAAEQARVVRVVGRFCQPQFMPNGVFAKTNHGTMRAVRRAVGAYLYAAVPVGARVLEVGPDVTNFVVSEDTDNLVGGRRVYAGARPALGPRDVTRMAWGELLGRVLDGGEKCRPSVGLKAAAVRAGVMENKRVEQFSQPFDGIISTDANYDVDFMSMPGVMARVGAKWWRGSMCRAKGLTQTTKLAGGHAELMGFNWRVDWKALRIDFRHPGCAAFGYSHAVGNYMHYEEKNGYVWNGGDAHYVYSKGPETNDELLFFSVFKVHYPMDIKEPRYTEHPHAGLVRLESVWAVGDEISGVPTAFQAVVFHVDALNFSKVLEKRRALDHKGDFSFTLNLIRSTNVIFFLNGTPVGAAVKIEAKLAEATALVVETLASEARLDANLVFDRSMRQFDIEVAKAPWLLRLLENVISMRVVMGSVVAPLHRAWATVRGPFESAALATVKRVRVSAVVEGQHIRLPEAGIGRVLDRFEPRSELCNCAEKLALEDVVARSGDPEARVRAGRQLANWPVEVCVCTVKLDDVFQDMAEDAGSDTSSDAGSSTTNVTEGSTEGSFSEDQPGSFYSEPEGYSSPERQSMEESIAVGSLQAAAVISEARIDAHRIWDVGISNAVLRGMQTNRTKHACLLFANNKSGRMIGVMDEEVSAVYDVARDLVIPVTCRAGVLIGPTAAAARLADGWYYTCNHFRVWNHAELAGAVQHALNSCVPKVRRGEYKVTLGVPGSGKTYTCMEWLAPMLRKAPSNALYLGVTKASVKAAIREALARGVTEKVAKARCMTLHSYLINKKIPTQWLGGDEAPAEHIGRYDAAVAISGATVVRLYGDACQVEYGTYVAGVVALHAAPGDTIPEENYVFLPETHRNAADVCAAWLHKYPKYYPCKCHATPEKEGSTMSATHVRTLADVEVPAGARVHTYKQDEKEEVRAVLGLGSDMEKLRALDRGGLATVHEDQGGTRPTVVSIRPFADYDRHQSAHNPSLHNRDCYVLSDTTRHTVSYEYFSVCAEVDGVFKAVERSRDPVRLRMVAEREGMVQVKLQTLWA